MSLRGHRKYEEYLFSLDDDVIVILDEFLLYFERTWIGLERLGRRQHPLFSHNLWSVRNRVNEGLLRTKNFVEGWHRAFDTRSITHLTIVRLASKLVKEQSMTEILLERFYAGQPLPTKKICTQLSARLETLVERYDTIGEFLRGIAHNLPL